MQNTDIHLLVTWCYEYRNIQIAYTVIKFIIFSDYNRLLIYYILGQKRNDTNIFIKIIFLSF
jgi:hypothetical protein